MGFGFDVLKGLLLPSSGKNIIETGADIVDRFVDTKGEKAEREAAAKAAKIEFDLTIREFAMQAEELNMKDRASAREMLKENGGKVQGGLTIIFTIGYFGLTTFMMGFLLKMIDIELNNFVVSFISSIFGAFNAIMVQIISFYFGSSKGGEDTGKAVSNSFKLASAKQDSKNP